MVRGPQSALHGSDAIGGVVQVITRNGGPLAVERARAKSAAARRAAAGRWCAAAPGRGTAAPAWRTTATTASPAAPSDGTTVTQRRRPRDAGVGHGRAGGTPRGTDLPARCSSSRPSADRPGRSARIRRQLRRRGPRLARPRPGAARAAAPDAAVGGPAAACASAPMPTWRTTTSSSGAVRELARRHGAHARARADRRGAVGRAGRHARRRLARASAAAARSSPTAPPPFPSSARLVAASARRAGSRRARVDHRRRARRAHHARRAARRSARRSGRGRFAADTINSVNPKITAAGWRCQNAATRGASTRLRAAFGTGIRPPDAFEIAFTDNPGLKPERSRSGEVGVTQTLAGGAVQLDATWFHNTYDDLIISVGRLAASSRYRTDNISNARARGAELRGVRPARALSARGNYTLLDSEILAVDGAARTGAVALPRRRPPAAAAAPSGQRRRHVEPGRLQAFAQRRCAARRSTPSPLSAPSAASSRTTATPWSRPARRSTLTRRSRSSGAS